MRMRGLIAAALLVVSGNLAFADNLDSEMEFQIYKADDDPTHIEIQADGGIAHDTPAKFRQFLADHNVQPGSDVYFTSGGGYLDAGLELGRIIRQHGFNTVVGAHQPISEAAKTRLQQYGAIMVTVPFFPFGRLLDARFTSYCVSACTFAFLGGVRRFVGMGSVFAVHKFNTNCDSEQMKRQKICLDPTVSESKAQNLSAELAVYLEEMGIPESFLKDMVLAEPHQLNWFGLDKFKQYGICTSGILTPNGC